MKDFVALDLNLEKDFITYLFREDKLFFYLLLPNNQLVKDPQNLQFLLLADVIFVLILLSMIIRQILLVFIYRKKDIGESRLYIKFINLFTAMALGPTIGVVILLHYFIIWNYERGMVALFVMQL